ncbi:MAG: DUF4387 domain-containing protein [Steroidobacteraceae bacterium]
MSKTTNAATLRLRDLAVCIRSKNAGPFMLTIDLFFSGPEDCRRVIDAHVLTPESIAAIYRVDAATVKIIYVAQANALKVSLPRARAAGDVGDCDVAGGQQFAPLMDLAVPA